MGFEQIEFVERQILHGNLIDNPFQEFQGLPYLDQCIILGIMADVPQKEIEATLGRSRQLPRAEVRYLFEEYYHKWHFLRTLL